MQLLNNQSSFDIEPYNIILQDLSILCLQNNELMFIQQVLLSNEFKAHIEENLNDFENCDIFENMMYAANFLKVITTITKDQNATTSILNIIIEIFHN